MYLGRTFLPATLALLASIGPTLGCRSSHEAAPIALAGGAEAELRARFPEHAAEVLDRAERFTRSGEGFTLGAVKARGGLSARLPSRGEGALHVGREGFEVSVREVGASGDAREAAGAVAYARSGGASYWSVTGEGLEEWLSLDAATASAGVAWEIEGATPWQAPGVVELRDEAGRARLRVRADRAFTASGRAVTPRLSVEGRRVVLRVDGGGEAVLVDPGWTTSAGQLSVARSFHSAALLTDGRVVVTGGDQFNAASDVYDPATDTFTTLAMTTAHYRGVSAALPYGGAFAAGGMDAVEITAVTEIFGGSSWYETSPNPSPRVESTAVVLADAGVMMVGGRDGGGYLGQTYMGGSTPWKFAGTLITPRCSPSATLLPDGRVLVAGGLDEADNPLQSTEIWSPTLLAFSAGPAMHVPRGEHAAVALTDGRVLLTGGGDPSGEIFDWKTNTFGPLIPNGPGDTRLSAVQLLGGHVLAAGGIDVATGTKSSAAFLFDPAGAGAWSAAFPMTTARSSFTLTRLFDGRVLATGGGSSSAEIFGPLALGRTCAGNADCVSGFCAGGVCCDSACDQPCYSCASGACTAAADSTPCDDGNPCSTGDVCQTIGASTVCRGTDAVLCPTSDPCLQGVCDPGTGKCSATPIPLGDDTPCSPKVGCQQGVCKSGACTLVDSTEGAECGTGDLCAPAGICAAGVCQPGASVITCAAPGPCQMEGTCDPATGACTYAAKDEGTTCDDGDLCTTADACHHGICAGVAVTCAPIDDCHTAGTCDPATGACPQTAIDGCGVGPDGGAPSKPTVAAGAKTCQKDAECSSGFCVGGVCCDARCDEPCHSCALPGAIGTCTLEPAGVDLGHDCSPVPSCLSTCGPDGSCVGATAGTQCEASRCVDETRGLGAATCEATGDSCPTEGSELFDCAPYRCEAAFGACFAKCQSVAECATGKVCSPAGACVDPPSGASGETAGCSVSAGGSSGGGLALLGVLGAFGAFARRRRAAAVAAGLLGALSGGCASEGSADRGAGGASFASERAAAKEPAAESLGGASSASALRARFPEVAGEILGRARALRPIAGGFAAPSEPTPRGGALSTITLPRRGEDAVTLKAPGFEASVRELGAAGEGRLAEGAVAYAREGGTSFWSTRERHGKGAGVEEWLLLDEGRAFADRPAASWRVAGASFRQQPGFVEVMDEQGRARFRVKAPRAYAAGGRLVPARLAAADDRLELFVDAAGAAVLADPGWYPADHLAAARAFHTATRLADGSVLVAGGVAAGNDALSVELFDPATGSWTTRTPLLASRSGHTATLLSNGKILLVGGGPLNPTAELYDTVADSSAPAGTGLSVSPKDGLAVPLGGGVFFYTATDVAFYSVGSWVSQPLITPTPPTGGYLAALPYDQAMHIGGLISGTPTASTYIYQEGGWRDGPPMTTPRANFGATILANGGVLVAGGAKSGGGAQLNADSEIFDGTSWGGNAALPFGDQEMELVTLGDGRVLYAGGLNFGTLTRLFDGSAWSTITPGYPIGRYHHTLTQLVDGRGLSVGGANFLTDALLDDVEIFGLLPNGKSCSVAGDCQSGFCAFGTCCESACSGACDDCSSTPGVCNSRPDTASCSDGLPCTVLAQCSGGVCKAVQEKECPSDTCQVGVCSPSTGDCVLRVADDGTACDDGDACTTGDACQAGVCQPATAKVCTALDACHSAGVCDKTSGNCTNPVNAAAEGMPCDDGDACTTGDRCVSGTCQGTAVVVFASTDACTLAACDPTTGSKVTSPAPAGTTCDDGDLCTTGDACASGVCQPGTKKTCVALDACHDVGTCDPATGKCSNPVKASCAPSLDGGSADAGTSSVPVGIKTCAFDSDCPAGSPCVDEVCCDSKCDSPCHSCALPGSIGTCTEAPAGVDLRHDCAPASQGCSETCGPGGTCIGAGASTQCAASRCTDDQRGVGPAYCPSQGADVACPTDQAIAFDCGHYRCEAALGACYATCQTADQCSPGSACDPSGRCVQAPDVASGSDPGCSIGDAGGGGSSGSSALVLAALALAGVGGARRARRHGGLAPPPRRG